MDRNCINEQIVDIMCKDFQTVWLIKLADMSLEVFKTDAQKSIEHSVDTALSIKSYDDVRLWYIEHNVVETSKNRLLEQTAMDYVLSQLQGNESFYIEYGRINKGEINFNQLCYDKVVDTESNEIEYIMLGFRDIDITKKLEIDDLTGLYVRHVFFDKAEEMMRRRPNEEFDILISDIVDFKKINETYGPKVADDILSWEGKYLMKLASPDLLIGRYGGDQMVMFGTRESIEGCIATPKKQLFAEAERQNGLPAIVIKFGIYRDVQVDAIIACCDKAHMALNSIKHHYNKDIAYYNDDIKELLDKQRRIENCMHESLSNGEFKVYYQPKHDAKTGKMVGAEALIRWIHPLYGFMSPADFIPLFEQNGFIVEVDHFVWRKTCENLTKWAAKGIRTVPVSVNSSKLTMIDSELVSVMKESLDSNGLSPELLHLEVTETLMTENVPALVKKLNEIRNMGVKVELDDFGSGYSSLNVLSTLPIDVLKLDMSFMQQFGDEKRSKVLAACINLAKELGFATVSEGVELEEQKCLLGELGVDMIQGYYYSKPLPEAEFEDYMMSH